MSYAAVGWIPSFAASWLPNWYAVQAGGRFLGPRKLSRGAATDWALDAQEQHWNSTVRLFELRDGRWVNVF
jgi:hypothetical protein